MTNTKAPEVAVSARPDVVFDMLEDIVFNGAVVYEQHPAQVALVERGLATVDHLLQLSPTSRGLYAVNEARVAAGEALLAMGVNAEGSRFDVMETGV